MLRSLRTVDYVAKGEPNRFSLFVLFFLRWAKKDAVINSPGAALGDKKNRRIIPLRKESVFLIKTVDFDGENCYNIFQWAKGAGVCPRL